MNTLFNYFFKNPAGIIVGMGMIICIVITYIIWNYPVDWINILALTILLFIVAFAQSLLLASFFDGMKKVIRMVDKKFNREKTNRVVAIVSIVVMLGITSIVIIDFSFDDMLISPAKLLICINNVYLSTAIYLDEVL